MVIAYSFSIIYLGQSYLFLMRITKVTTKTGDNGETGLVKNVRLSKDHPRIVAIGEIDHLNSFLGWSISECSDSALRSDLKDIQQDLFNLGGELAMPDIQHLLLKDQRLMFLEQKIEMFTEKLPPLEEFVLPGGIEFSSRLHIARSGCRSAERAIVALYKKEVGITLHIKYLNRLSDYLFSLARWVNLSGGGKDEEWIHEK